MAGTVASDARSAAVSNRAASSNAWSDATPASNSASPSADDSALSPERAIRARSAWPSSPVMSLR